MTADRRVEQDDMANGHEERSGTDRRVSPAVGDLQSRPDRWADHKATQDAMIQVKASIDPAKSAQYLTRLYKARAALAKAKS